MPEAVEVDVFLRPLVNEIRRQSCELSTNIANDAEVPTDFDLHAVCDSLDAIDLVMALEEHFDVYFEDEEVETLRTYGHLVGLVQRKVAAS